MTSLLDSYAAVAGEDVVEHLRQIAEPLRGRTVVHVNSTRVGGGVAEILDKMVPLMRELGIDTHWEIITGESEFYQCTKGLHNALQGNPVGISEALWSAYHETNARNASDLAPILREADHVIIHDPQPAPLISHFPDRKGRWVWRCHIDASHPYRPVWKTLRQQVEAYDASVFSLPAFSQALPHPQYIVPPSIDPLSDKNVDLPSAEVDAIFERFDLDPSRPLISQISRFDRFKDPVGVIQAFHLVKRFQPDVQLVLAGGGASDDPEGDEVLREVHAAAGEEKDIHVLLLPPDAHRTINALQRASDIVLQKSTREGFGLTVTEALWKGRPVVGGNTGGIVLQVVDHNTGFLVSTPEGAALRIRYLLNQPQMREQMGRRAREFVRENFLLTRQTRDYLALLLGTRNGARDRIELA